MLQARYNGAITPQDVYNLKSKIARMDHNNTAAKNVAMRDSAPAELPTDPALEMHNTAPSVVDEDDVRKCACQCCDHGVGDAHLRPPVG